MRCPDPNPEKCKNSGDAVFNADSYFHGIPEDSEPDFTEKPQATILMDFLRTQGIEPDLPGQSLETTDQLDARMVVVILMINNVNNIN